MLFLLLLRQTVCVGVVRIESYGLSEKKQKEEREET